MGTASVVEVVRRNYTAFSRQAKEEKKAALNPVVDFCFETHFASCVTSILKCHVKPTAQPYCIQSRLYSVLGRIGAAPLTFPRDMKIMNRKNILRHHNWMN